MRGDRARHWHDLPCSSLANDDELLYPDGWATSARHCPMIAWGIPIRGLRSPGARLHDGGPGRLCRHPPGRCSRSATLRQGCRSSSVVRLEPDHCPVSPAFASAWRAGEMVEVYWAALLRDVPFTEYGTHPWSRRPAAISYA